ncbi:MAG: hypothetical protein GY795_49860, partial [Desulfobacterales bacterium]|nr:hypothetical protein [Desulfobacterales bacterium]
MSEMSISQLCEFMKFGLGQQSLDLSGQTKAFRVKSIKLMNNNILLCEFYPYLKTSIEIKTEIGFIMGFFYSFCKDNEFIPSEIQNFAVRAYSENDEEILYAISSREAAKYISEGKAIEWLKNSIFQDNSDDFRMSLAKSKISELENSLRKIICEVLSDNNGTNWWNICVESKIRKNAEKAFKNQRGVSVSIGEELIYFTYLLQLRDIIGSLVIRVTVIFFIKQYIIVFCSFSDSLYNRSHSISSGFQADKEGSP